MKTVFFIADGMADLPCMELNGLTPLEAAKTPNMDLIAKKGISGLMDIIKPGTVPGSDVAHLALFGLDPYEYYTGRGPFEAAGLGLDVYPGDIAARVNFATRNADGIVIDRRAGRIREGTAELANLLDGLEIDGVKILFKAGSEHRSALILRGRGLSDRIQSNDPKKEGKPFYEVKALEDTDSAKKTVNIIKKLIKIAEEKFLSAEVNKRRVEANQLLANTLLIRGFGQAPHIPSFLQRTNMKSVCVAGGGLYKGVAALLGMDVIDVPGATGGVTSDIEMKVKYAIEALDSYDFVFLHIKGTDNYGHDGNALGKKEFIEKIDKVIEPLVKVCERGDLVVITSDHSTPCIAKDHTADP
ncbi:MAG: 2,3-bisphosphoglycerate-independent phosphoglycerate mutase, partial [Candidatus Heimdallarchaeota archaeon]|nr:2,3-bisphosphoglycerate-independent phosphoglycerate mutase [Candidatus Heimdallarchaeota archaeon]MCK5047896.1 2,3-bisphosphoglycerate-independent phosphoglycerate mutase [Candidatus Heimdallarchaeota archaeon]